MKKLTVALVLVAGMAALHVPAAAAKGTHVSITSWHLYTSAPKPHKVKPGATFKTCASDPVVDIYAKGRIKGAKKGAKFEEDWWVGSAQAIPIDATWGRSGNFTDYFRFQPEGKSGKVKLKLVEAGKKIGSGTVTIKTKKTC